ncbi:hypothetical protein M2163_000319 [Streptomyces sp. SAI-135]|nr:hypothetical protein [Streptomyces sp. SAI-041]MDH6574060.1 hypothetical protein [Streptomyces sp. SAI-117]MDH6581204.1 hypothetical protein [Streptomyces sp. SAI-133]MDH6613211.1 hypothetical protein [Streptomyces sp. SAI-135]
MAETNAALRCGRLVATDLDLGGVQAQFGAFGLGVGEHIRQCPKTQAGMVGDRASTFGQERA